MATELEDVANLIPDKLASAIADIEAELLRPPTAYALVWLSSIPRIIGSKLIS